VLVVEKLQLVVAAKLFAFLGESVVSDLEGLKTTSVFQQLLNRIEGWGSPGSGSMPSDQTSDHAAG
jgi:hypothetical protein